MESKLPVSINIHFNKICALMVSSESLAIKKDFLKLVSYAKNFDISCIDKPVFNNQKLSASANRVVLPHVFRKFQEYIELSLGRPVNLDLRITAEEVREKDEEILSLSEKPDFSWKSLNLDRLIEASIITAKELGIYGDGVSFLTSDLDDCLDSLPSNTSTSFPDYLKKNNPIAIANVKELFASFIEKPSYEFLLSYPCTIYHRFRVYLNDALTENSVKSRLVWGYPFIITLIEAFYFRNLLDAVLFKSKHPNYNASALGLTNSEISDKIISMLRDTYSCIFSEDSKNFDMTIKSWFYPLFYVFVFRSILLKNSNEKEGLLALMLYQLNTPYCLRNVFLRIKRKGNSSGSLITACFNTFVSRVKAHYTFLEASKDLRDAKGQHSCLGDDNIYSLKYVTAGDIIRVSRNFGFIINVDKSGITKPGENFSFLGRIWDTLCRPIQSLSWYVSHLCVPSRFYSNPPFPIPVLQTYRALSVVSQYYMGLDTFIKLIGYKDVYFAELMRMFNAGDEPVIRYVGGKEKYLFQPIPLRSIIEDGWRFF